VLLCKPAYIPGKSLVGRLENVDDVEFPVEKTLRGLDDYEVRSDAHFLFPAERQALVPREGVEPAGVEDRVKKIRIVPLAGKGNHAVGGPAFLNALLPFLRHAAVDIEYDFAAGGGLHQGVGRVVYGDRAATGIGEAESARCGDLLANAGE
jgi:hypothetical protein